MPITLSSRMARIVLATILLGFAFAVKWWYRTASVDDLGFVLRPVAALTGAFTGEAWTYMPGQGYWFPGLRVLIDGSCSGINFLIITTATFAFLILRRPGMGCSAPLLAVIATSGAYLLTIVTNAGRILTMIHVQRAGLLPGPTAHEALGAFFFVLALLAAALLLDRFLSRKPPPDAQLA
jgi:exosortase K